MDNGLWIESVVKIEDEEDGLKSEFESADDINVLDSMAEK
jgi:hypothetical protein